jgi:DNA-binding MarR family transcriptional regulator
MRPQSERELEILSAIEEGTPLTQRLLAQRLGVAVGLTNLYLKRLAHKGLIKVAGFPKRPAARKRLRYVLTPRGLTEKTRLTYEHVAYALSLYRRTRQTLRESLARLPGDGRSRVALYGAGEAAELAYLTLKESGREPVGVYTEEGGGHFIAFPVQKLADLDPDSVDAIVVASFERPEPVLANLIARGLPQHKLITIRGAVPTPARARNGETRA